MPFAQLQEATIYYEVHGDGHPLVLVLVHGGGGNTLSWFQQVPHFSRKYQVITVDLRGFKHSKCAPKAVHLRFFPNFLVVRFISAVLLSLGFQRLANPILSDSPGKPPPLNLQLNLGHLPHI